MTKSIWGLLLLLVFSLSLGSCSQDKDADAEALLATVPATANGAMVINVRSLLEKSGCTVKDNQVTLSPELEKRLTEMNDSSAKASITGLIKGEGGVTISWLVAFWDSYPCITGHLADPDKFRTYVEKELGQQFEEKNGVNVIEGQVAFIGNQFWLGPEGLPAVTELARYPKLEKDQSLAGSRYAEALLEGSKDAIGMAKVASVINMQKERTQLMLALNMLFDGANVLTFSADLQKEDLVYTAALLNSDGKPAKFLLPTQKIDTKVVADLDCDGVMFGAVALPSELTQKLVGLAKSFGGGLPESLTKPLEEIDGTTAFAVGQDNGNNLKAIISTKNRPTAQLTELIGNMSGAIVTVDGNRLYLSRDLKPAGKLKASEAAPLFKDAMFGFVGNMGDALSIKMDDETAGISSLMFIPEKGSLTIKGKVGIGKGGWTGFINRL